MAASGSSFIPTPLAHANNLGEGHPRGRPYNGAQQNVIYITPRDQEPTDFIYDLLKLHKQLGLGMSEEALVDPIFVRLKPQVKDYVDVPNPQYMVQLLEVLSKFEERYSCKTMRCSMNSDNVER
ncbi:uncharacterized protein TNCV_4147621 [Trichonephila clavipes]|nr:uncharacterized protein TNCV_4147621 [Trichonephila clavipes]